LPVYLDGIFSIYELADDSNSDYPKTILKKVKSSISFSELQIFDNTKNAYKTMGVEVVKKIRTRPIRLSKRYYLKIDDDMYKIENSVTALNSSGFEETDITMSIFTKSFEIQEE
jgi:hypothetical protein